MLVPLLLFLAAAHPVRDLSREFERIAADARGHVGATVRVVETGEQYSFKGSDHFPMQSVYKLPIAMAVLHANPSLDQSVHIGKSDLVPKALHSPIRDAHPAGDFTMPLREVLRYAISESDGTASDVLMRFAGGAARVMDYLRELGVKDIVVANTEYEMSRDVQVQYRNWATPEAAVLLLTKLSANHDAQLLRWMSEGPTGLKRIKGMLPSGTAVAHKTGTSGTDGGLTHATNDIGLVTLPDGRHLAIAVFVSDSRADNDTREAVIARIARAAWDAYTQPAH